MKEQDDIPDVLKIYKPDSTSSKQEVPLSLQTTSTTTGGDVLTRLKHFLPVIAQANAELSEEAKCSLDLQLRSSDSSSSDDLDSDVSDSECDASGLGPDGHSSSKVAIEMKLGVFQYDESDSDSDDSSKGFCSDSEEAKEEIVIGNSAEVLRKRKRTGNPRITEIEKTSTNENCEN